MKIEHNTQLILDEARKRKIPAFSLSRVNPNIIQLGYGRYGIRLKNDNPETTSSIANTFAHNKLITKELLAMHALPVPDSGTFTKEVEAAKYFKGAKKPLVVKPSDAARGKGVSMNVATMSEFRKAWKNAKAYSKSSEIMLEQQVSGRVYRILVIEGKVAAVSERAFPSVVGTGRHTVKQLINIANDDPKRGESEEMLPLVTLRIDQELKNTLRHQGYGLKTKPRKGERVYLRHNSNIETGASSTSIPLSKVHPAVKKLAEDATRIIGLDIAGVDYIASSITGAPEKTHGSIIEVGHGPGIRGHHFPAKGKPVNVAAKIVHALISKNKSRIPVTLHIARDRKPTLHKETEGHVLVSVNSVILESKKLERIAFEDALMLAVREKTTKEISIALSTSEVDDLHNFFEDPDFLSEIVFYGTSTDEIYQYLHLLKQRFTLPKTVILGTIYKDKDSQKLLKDFHIQYKKQ